MNEQLKLPLAVFALTVGSYILLAYFLGWFVYLLGDFGLQLLIGSVLGAVAAGITFALAPKS